MLRATFLAAAALAAASPLALRAQPSADSVTVERLATLGRVFGAVKYFHPAFLERDVPWDSAVVVAVDRVIAARGDEDYVSAVEALLASLGDPATRVVRKESPPAAAQPAQRSRRWEVSGGDSVLVFAISDFTGWQAAAALLTAGTDDIRKGTPVVFDLRGPEPAEQGYAGWVFGTHPAASLLPAASVTTPADRRRMHNGFVPQSGGTSGGYWSGTYEVAGATIHVQEPNPSRRIVFLVNPWSDIPPLAHALRGTGQGAIVAEGSTTELRGSATTYALRLTDEARAVLRIGTPAVDLRADTAVAAADGASGVALALARAPVAPPRPPARETSAFVPPPEPGYPAMRYPGTGYRVLAAYRFWNAIHYFFPYKHLVDEPWSATLPRGIRLMLAARDSLEYALAAAEMTTYMRDSHGGIAGSTALASFMGRVPAGVQLQYIEGQPVVIRVVDDSATRASGIAVGDVILSVDGETAAARRARIAKYIAHSTPHALDNAVARRLLSGADSTDARVTVRDRSDQVRELSLPRRMGLSQLLAYPRTGPIMQILPGNIGYADLARLTVPAVEMMFEMFKDTKAIVFDGRGYPQGTAWAIAPRLTEKESVPAAAFRRPIVMSPDSSEWTTYEFIQHTPPTTQPRYRGRTVMLMDERTISQAEHTGLFFEAANGTVFIGSPTMGANGDVTSIVLPGGLIAWFTGHDVRHADGRQLQRVGLQPHVFVRPTLAGVREGRDEVLEKALEYLRQ